MFHKSGHYLMNGKKEQLKPIEEEKEEEIKKDTIEKPREDAEAQARPTLKRSALAEIEE